LHTGLPMRVVAAVLLVAAAGSVALAGDAAPPTPRVEVRPARPKLPLRVIRTMPETKQALVLDTEHHSYLVVDVGASVAGFAVADVDDDSVTFDAPGGIELVVTVAGAPVKVSPAPAVAIVAPAAPADATKSTEPTPVDPYGDPEVRVVEAPAAPVAVSAAAPSPTSVPATATAAVITVPAASPVTVAAPVAVAAPVTAAVPVTVTATVSAPTVPVPATATPTTAPSPDAPIILSRASLTAALSNFAQLAGSMRGSLTPDGVRLDYLAPDSLFAHVGLANHDLVVAVDNHPVRTLDDAATLYARAASAHNVTIQVVRVGKPLTLHVAIE
jgi:hypothetical protein